MSGRRSGLAPASPLHLYGILSKEAQSGARLGQKRTLTFWSNERQCFGMEMCQAGKPVHPMQVALDR